MQENFLEEAESEELNWFHNRYTFFVICAIMYSEKVACKLQEVIYMQIYDFNNYLSLGKIDTNSYFDNSDINDTNSIDTSEQFQNVLQDYMNKEYQTELEQKAIEVEPTEEKEVNSNYLSDLSESMLNTSSGRKVIASMMENQIMGIVTGSVDEEQNETLQALLLGTEATNTVSDLEQTLMSLKTLEAQTDKK